MKKKQHKIYDDAFSYFSPEHTSRRERLLAMLDQYDKPNRYSFVQKQRQIHNKLRHKYTNIIKLSETCDRIVLDYITTTMPHLLQEVQALTKEPTERVLTNALELYYYYKLEQYGFADKLIQMHSEEEKEKEK